MEKTSNSEERYGAPANYYSTSPAYWSYHFPADEKSKKNDDLSPSVNGCPDFNSMIAGAMYQSLHNNYDYILQTQYGVGMDCHGNLWGGMMTAPKLKTNEKSNETKSNFYTMHDHSCNKNNLNSNAENMYNKYNSNFQEEQKIHKISSKRKKEWWQTVGCC